MTGIILLRDPDRINLLTDGVGYDAEGIVRQIDRKVHHLDCGVGAVFCRGQVDVTEPIVENIRAAEHELDWLNFDKLADLLDMVCRITQEERQDFHGRPLECEVYLAGWSPANQRMEAYLWMGGDHAAPVIERGKTHPINVELLCSPDPEDALCRATYGLPNDGDIIELLYRHFEANGFDGRVDGFKLMECQRRGVTRPDDGSHLPVGTSTVGGFCLLTTITPEGCTDEVLWTWPDRIGAPIVIEPSERLQ